MNSKNMLLVSVVVPAYNVEVWISQCIESVLNQSYSNFELIIVDDGSTDNTVVVVEKYATSDSRIKIFHQTNSGPSVSRNTAMKLAKGSILVFVDADDWIHPDLLIDAVAQFANADIDAVFYQCAKFYNETGTWSSCSEDYYWNSMKKRLVEAKEVDSMPELYALYPLAQLKVISADFVKNNHLQFLAGKKYEDNDFLVSMLSCRPRVSLMTHRYYAWRQERPEQITSSAHPRDCEAVVSEILAQSKTLDSKFKPYLVVLIMRLISGVAKSMNSSSDRRAFLKSMKKAISSQVDTGLLGMVGMQVKPSISIHPGDLLMIRSLFYTEDHFCTALGTGYRRYAGGIACLLLSSKKTRFTLDLDLILHYLRNAKSILSYMRGHGDARISGLG